jgi:hypothetical protein
MKFPSRFLSYAAMALVTLLPCDGCKSSNQPANNQQAGSQPSGSQANPNGQPAQSAGQPPQSSDQTNSANSASSPGAPSAQQASAAPQAPPPPQVVDLPAGTRLRVSLDQDLGSKISQPGDGFNATIEDAVVINGQTVIPRGARAEGTVIDAKPLGRFKGGALLEIRLERVHTNWGSYPVATSSIERAEKGKGKRTGLFAAGGGGFGAIIGGLAGGGKGALIGGLAGAGAGTATSAFTGNKEIFLPAETLLTFHLEHSVHITEQ